MSTFQDRIDEAVAVVGGKHAELARRIRQKYGEKCTAQAIQYLSSRTREKPATSSRLTPFIAEVVGFRAEYLAKGRLPKYASLGVRTNSQDYDASPETYRVRRLIEKIKKAEQKEKLTPQIIQAMETMLDLTDNEHSY